MRVSSMFAKFLLQLSVVSFVATQVPAQDAKPREPEPPADVIRSGPNKEQNEGLGLPDEMKARMLIERSENEYKKVIESVDKMNSLSGEIAGKFHQAGRLSADDVKKLGTIEKLARQVLSHSGGEAVEEKDPQPGTVGDAIDQMNTAAARIKKDVSAETRFVVSATVIANSNEVINLSRFIRRTQKN